MTGVQTCALPIFGLAGALQGAIGHAHAHGRGLKRDAGGRLALKLGLLLLEGGHERAHALQLYETKNNSLLSGQGKFNQANSVDSLVSQYIQRGYRDDAVSKNASNKEDIFLWYQCKDGSGAVTGVAVFASLNSPTSDESSRVATIKADCHIAASVPTSGNPAYNYAQVF